MKSILISVLICLGLIFTQDLQAQKLKKFASSIEKKLGTKKIKAPYTDVVFYLGYAELGTEDDIFKNKKIYLSVSMGSCCGTRVRSMHGLSSQWVKN